MYSVVVVDDEQYDLEGLVQFMPWAELDMEVVGSFHDAFSALEYIRQQHIDLLVTDIHMPIMSGLELAEQALQLQPQLKLVFVTGHEDFQFAKRALTMQACSYVLKPVDDDELIDVLQQIAARLRQAEQEQKQLQTMKSSMLYVKHELLRRCLLGVYDEHIAAALTQQYALFSTAISQHVAIVEVDDTRWKLQQFDELEKKQQLEQVYHLFTRLCAQHHIELYCQLTPHRYALLLNESQELQPGRTNPQISSPHDGLQSQSSWQHMLLSWIAQIEQQLDFTITIGVGSAVRHIDRLQLSFNQALQALSSKMVCGKRTVIIYRQRMAADTAQSWSGDIEALLKGLYSDIAHYDLVAIVDRIEQLFAYAADLPNETSVYQFVLYWISKLEGCMEQDNEDLYELLQSDRSQWEIMLQFETVEDIERWLRNILFKLSESIYCRKRSQPSRLVQEVQQYIAQRLDENITLKRAAQQFAFSPNYLGYMFKNEVGSSFNEYVTKLRMEKAKSLLQDPSKKVYEVASAIGYKDLTYFSKQFKEFTGMTAGDYRKRC